MHGISALDCIWGLKLYSFLLLKGTIIFLGGLVKNTLHLFSEFQDQKKVSASGLFLKCS